MLWGTLVLGWRSEGRGCKAITPVTAANADGWLLLTIPSNSPSTSRWLHPGSRRRCSHWRPQSWGTVLPSLPGATCILPQG